MQVGNNVFHTRLRFRYKGASFFNGEKIDYARTPNAHVLSALLLKLLGALLLYGAWRVGKDARMGQRFLAAGWAFMCGMAYLSFFGQLHNIRLGVHDPAPISSTWVALIKGIGLALGVIGLVTSLKKLPFMNSMGSET